ncbi:hypothetical protein C8J57DRAFT_1717911 [Mycena rebaudengoi]|nr:hypothetical protein C8J57DRAFT_1717911 [Mycena rebaudengoi]
MTSGHCAGCRLSSDVSPSSPFCRASTSGSSDIQSGTITLSRSFFVILVVAHLSPIRRLVISKMNHRNDYVQLASVLSVAAPIPDILIYNYDDSFRRTIEIPYLLARIPQTAYSPLLIVKDDSIIASCYRVPRPQRRDLPRLNLSGFHSTRQKTMAAAIWGFPLIVKYFMWLIMSCLTTITWAYRRTFGPPWDQYFRIRGDVGGPLYSGHWMRIQPLPTVAGDFALVTIACHSSKPLCFRHIPNLAPETYSALLATLELSNHLTQLRVEQQTGLPHSDLLGFLQRHPRVQNLTLEQDSIDPSSFVARWNLPQTLRGLEAPVSYIPKLLPTQPNLANIEITFPRSGSETDVAVFDLPGYYEALDAVASLPGTEPICLTLTLPVPEPSLPWLNTADASMLSGKSRPETRLHRVQLLRLASQAELAFSADIIRDLLPPWLALFPALTHVRFRPGCVTVAAAALRRELAHAIADACLNIVQPENVIIEMQ